MPKLGEFIGALLSDAVQARVRADLEALKIAETYSAHALLKHMPVPRFRLPDITVDFPVIISGVGGTDAAVGKAFEKPTDDEIRNALQKLPGQSKLLADPQVMDRVASAVLQNSKRLFGTEPQFMPSPAKISGELAGTVVNEVKLASRDKEPDKTELKALENAAKTSLQTLLLGKMTQSPFLQVAVSSAEIKSHGNNDSVVRMRLTITENSYEVVNRDEGHGYYLTPE